MIYTCVARFNVMRNLKNYKIFLKLNKASVSTCRRILHGQHKRTGARARPRKVLDARPQQYYRLHHWALHF